MRTTLLMTVVLFSRQANSMDLKLDIAGGRCSNNTDFDSTFDVGVMPGTQEVMDITTDTIDEEASREYGYSAYRGDDIANIDYQFHEEMENLLEKASRQKQNQEPRSLPPDESDSEVEENKPPKLRLDCPVYKECPGSGNPTHWCAWICGYYHRRYSSSPEIEAEQRDPDEVGGLRFLRRVTEDLRIPEAELEPIRYTPQDRELWVSIESLVCGWIQRWLDSGLSDCLHGSTLVACELDLSR